MQEGGLSNREVAEWVVEQMGTSHWLYQETIVYKIKNHWGNAYVYANASGNPAISKGVLKEFRKLTEDTLVWERGARAWRPKKPGETKRGVE
jgi:uncharacterized protein DUF6953